MQDKGHCNARWHILRYAGRNVHDGNGTLHPILSGGRQKPPTFFREHDGEKESRQRNHCPNLRLQMNIKYLTVQNLFLFGGHFYNVVF